MASRGTHEVVKSVACDDRTPAQVGRAFRALLEQGMTIRVAGAAKRRPKQLLTRGYTPRHAFTLFGTRFYVSVVRQNPELRFCVAYVVPPSRPGRPPIAHARIFYKDLSLVWRAASHVAYDRDGSIWIGRQAGIEGVGKPREGVVEGQGFEGGHGAVAIG